MTESDLTKRLDTLVERITARNKETQEAKKSGPVGWPLALVLALVSLVGIGVAMWLAARRNRELGKLRTQLEQDEVAQTQARHEARKITLLQQRNTVMAELTKKEEELQERRKKMFMADAQHRIRLRKIESLNAWRELNEI